MVDFVLVGVLVIAVCVALLQLALGLHVRNVLTDAALADGYVDEVTVTRTRVGGTPVVQAEVTAPLPVLGLFGPAGSLRVTGHAVDEAALVTAAREEP